MVWGIDTVSQCYNDGESQWYGELIVSQCYNDGIRRHSTSVVIMKGTVRGIWRSNSDTVP